jgi:hypothetical protein
LCIHDRYVFGSYYDSQTRDLNTLYGRRVSPSWSKTYWAPNWVQSYDSRSVNGGYGSVAATQMKAAFSGAEASLACAGHAQTGLIWRRPAHDDQ